MVSSAVDVSESGVAVQDSRVPAEGAVVIGPLSGATRAKLERASPGELSQISESPPMLLVEAAGNPRSLVSRLNEVIGDEGYVAPVLADPDGNRLFPTGHLQVRFADPVSDDRLSTFAERHGVELAGRNRWAPQQVEFAVRPHDQRFLPDLAASMAGEPGVVAAWPAAKAAFRRTK